MQVTVHYNRLLVAPRKLRAVLFTLRHRTVSEAMALMDASPRATTEPITKLLKASISAARDRSPALRPTELRVAEVYCNDAARAYRTRQKGRGRSSSFAKRGSHLTLTVQWTEARDREIKGSETKQSKTRTPISDLRTPNSVPSKAQPNKRARTTQTKSASK